jgi:hypothetical protein
MSSIIINYAVEGESSLAAAKYVLQADSNPTSIVANESVVLDFIADGLYFMLMPLKAKVIVENASLVSWACKSPFNLGTLTISNVVDDSVDVIVTIPVKVKIAPQSVTKPFLFQVASPADTRMILTKAEMKSMAATYMPEVYFALCKDDGHFYLYNKANAIDEETGRFTIITDFIEKTIKVVDGGEIVPLETEA